MGRGTPPPQGAGPYSTGGGGVVLEQRYGAVLLSHLLTGTPVPGLGDTVTPSTVRFQAKAVTAVDDFLVSGLAPDGATHNLSVAVRRRPKLIPSEPPSVQLIGSYLTAIADHWPLLLSRRWHLALAVAPVCPPAHQLKDLAVAAVAAGSNAQFRARLTQPGCPNAHVRARLKQLDALVQTAIDQGAPDSDLPAGELAWRLLARLVLVELRLEGADRSDRTHAVARLQPATHTGLVEDGDTLFSRLVELAGSYAPSGAAVDLPTLQGDLRGLKGVRVADGPAEGAETASAIRPAAATRTGRLHPGSRPPATGAVKSRPPWEQWTVEQRLFPGASQPQLCEGTLLVRDRYMLHAFDAATGSGLWGTQTAFNGRPALGGGAVYTADRTGSVLPRDLRTGRKRAPLAGRIRDGLAVYDRGTLYGPGPDGKLHALDTRSGTHLWSAPGHGRVDAAAPQVTIATVYAVLADAPVVPGAEPVTGGLLALDTATGRPCWPRPARIPGIQQWTATDQAVYLVHRTGTHSRLVALDTEGGVLLWDYPLHDDPAAVPVVADSTVYLTGTSGHVYAVQAGTGRGLWTRRLGKRITAAPVASGSLVLVGSWNPGRLTALDARSGEPAWPRAGRGTGAFASAPIVTGSTVWAAHRAGILQSWDLATGRQLPARYEDLLWDPVQQGEPAVLDGALYVTTMRGVLRCLSLC